MELRQTATYWDEHVDQHVVDGYNTNRAEWLAHPVVVERHRRLLGGTPLEWLIKRIEPQLGRGLGFGCGAARFELELLARGVVEEFDLFDVSPGSLAAAAILAEELGVRDRVRLHCCDVLSAPDAEYDIITCVSSLHHAVDMASSVHFIARHLSADGVLYAQEYVGPNRFAYPAEDAQYARAVYAGLDLSLRSEWPELPLPDPVEVERADATEAAQSEILISQVAAMFQELETVSLGGALPFSLWWGLNHDALWEAEGGRRFVDMLLDLDDALQAAQLVPPYFAVLLASRPRRERLSAG